MARKTQIVSAKNTPTCYSSWLSFTANCLSILTFILIAMLVITAIAVAAKIASIVKKIEKIIEIPIKYVQKAENVIDIQAARIKQYAKEQQNIAENLRTGAMTVKENTTQKIKSKFSSLNNERENYII